MSSRSWLGWWRHRPLLSVPEPCAGNPLHLSIHVKQHRPSNTKGVTQWLP